MTSTLFYCEPEEYYRDFRRHLPEPHFLAACSMCRRPLAADRDIFMYKGIDAFCSQECRQHQIQIDSRPPKKTGWDLSSSIRALKKVAARSWRPTAAATTA